MWGKCGSEGASSRLRSEGDGPVKPPFRISSERGMNHCFGG